ncbi:trem-like transcript 4 protein isoform X1 [Ochotona curzoniae]|uniref:trem-like transcript 4 protein isoform X1 n=2 Tax=Ochotona curzoniae TaxID=130825 RepID=UPI001B34C83E|nr:trem-like transcript 4 protein isoform X1 [Ochotona curzoniae]XP_040839279.1 trem-like transcript 4 protein isoform X1 [Ochotona curzoniae]
MAWEAIHLLLPGLLMLQASGSWGQIPEILQKLEGEAISVTCYYSAEQHTKLKTWCRQTGTNLCTLLVDSSQSWAQDPRCSLQDDHHSAHFIVTMKRLTVMDSGLYWCGVYESSGVFPLRTIQLMVSQAPVPSSTRNAWKTIALASTSSPVNARPPDSGKSVLSGVVVTVLLLLLALLVVLGLRKKQKRTRKGKDGALDVCSLSVLKEPTGADQQPTYEEELTEAIHYASLTHLSPEDPLYANIYCTMKPARDLILSVEYTSVKRSKSPGPQTRCLRPSAWESQAEFPDQ